MSAVVIPATCTCGSIGRTDLRQCPDHFKLWNGDVRLTSVGRIVYGSFPLDSTIPAATLENARDRGSEVDVLFGAYVLGRLTVIPAGTRKDAELLFYKVQDWYDRQSFTSVKVQEVLGCEDHGGVLDFRFDDEPVDLKCTYNVEHTARLQIAGYATLAASKSPGFILHATARNKDAQLVPLAEQDRDDWKLEVAHWRMVQRRAPAKKGVEVEEMLL